MSSDPSAERGEIESTFDRLGHAVSDHDDAEATVVDEVPGATELGAGNLVERGAKIGRYVVVEELGSGAMGTVYRAYDPELDRGIALKIVEIRSARWRHPEEIRARVMREAQAIARVQHPNVVQVFDVGSMDHAVWVAMEFVDGSTLKQWSRDPERTWPEVVHAFVCAGEGLAAAHRAEIVHRDFKPENVMIGHDGRVRVLDFGLARALSGHTTRDNPRSELEGLEPLVDSAGPLDASLTGHGMVMGTPAYMAPEQHLGKTADAAADQFSFCVSLFEALYGSRPFRGDTHATLAFAVTQGKLNPPADDRGVPRWVHALILRGLSTDAHARHVDMKALVAALEADPAKKRRRLAVAGVVVLALAGTAAAARAVGGIDETQPCTGAAEHFDGIWGEAERTAMQTAFDATALPFAPNSYASAVASLDQWQGQWIDTHTDACRATRVLGEQSSERMDLRMSCLERHLTEFAATVAVLQTAEHDVVVGAIDAARSLPRLATCDDLEFLTARVPPPSDASQREALETLEGTLASIGARANAGTFRTLTDRLDAIESDVRSVAYAPLSAQYFKLRGHVQASTGDARGARTSWERAFALSVAAGDMRAAALAAAKLVHIIGHRLSQRDDAERWHTIASELLVAVAQPAEVALSLKSAQATMLSMHGDYDTAAKLEAQVADYWATHDPDNPNHGVAVGNMANAEQLRGNVEQAAAYAQQELTIMREHYGPQHPETGSALSRVASALSYARKFDDARPRFEEAIEVLRAGEGDDSVRLATALDGLGRVFRQQGKLDEAVTRHRQALAVWRKAVGQIHPDVAVCLMHVGYTLTAKEDLDGALEVFDEAESVLRAAVGDEHPQLIYIANSRASIRLELGRADEAITIVERGLAMEATSQVDPTLVAESQFILARALWTSDGDRTRALVLARKARDAYAQGSSVWAKELAQIDAWLQER